MTWRVVPLAVVLCTAALAAEPASALTGLLQRTEICTDEGGYASLENIAVLSGGAQILVVARGEGEPVIHRLTSSGRLTKPFVPSGFPGAGIQGGSGPVILDRGPPGTVYVVDSSLTSHFYEASASGAFRRELTGPGGIPYRDPVGALASKTNELFLLDAGRVIAFDLKTGEAKWSDDTEDGDPRGSTAVAVHTIHGGLAIAKTHYSGGVQDRVSIFRTSASGLDYGLTINVPPLVRDIAGRPDDTMWVLTAGGLYRYNLQGEQLEALPGVVPAFSVDAAPDGTAWVSRADGVLHIGEGGTTIPKSVYNAGSEDCGPARIRTRYAPTQNLFTTGRLLFKVSCSEPCVIRSSGVLRANGRTIALRPGRGAGGEGRPASVPIGFPRSALVALRRSVRSGRAGRLDLTLVATDRGGNRTIQKKTLRLR
jgi:hypothetical protein